MADYTIKVTLSEEKINAAIKRAGKVDQWTEAIKDLDGLIEDAINSVDWKKMVMQRIEQSDFEG